jgi:hypothetical protein
MHIPPFDNQNRPIVDVNDSRVPLNYFNIVKLRAYEAFNYQVPGYETVIVPATGTVDVMVEGETYAGIGNRGVDVWDGEPEGVYVPSGAKAEFVCTSNHAEVFIAGAKFSETLSPFAVRKHEIDLVQYGSDDTKTHRKIKHIFGAKQRDRMGRLLVSELFTPAFHRTNMTRIACRWKRATTKLTTFDSARATALACNSCNVLMERSARPITSSMVQRLSSTMVITLAWPHLAMKCITSQFLAGCRSARSCNSFNPHMPIRLKPFPASRT